MSAGRAVWGACRALARRPRPAIHPRAAGFWTRPTTRFYSDQVPDNPSKPDRAVETPRASDTAEDADALSNTFAQEPSTLEESANAAEVLSSLLEESGKNALERMLSQSQDSPLSGMDDAALEQMMYGGRVAKSPTEGGLTPMQEETLYREGVIPPAEDVEVSGGEKAPTQAVEAAEAVVSPLDAEARERPKDDDENQWELVAPEELDSPGHKFGLPKKPYPPGFHLKRRYHPVVEQMARLLMRDGKLSVAQRNMAMVMNFLRSSPTPIYSPKFPLLPGAPPASHLPLNPILYITLAIDSLAPLIRVRGIPGAAGGGRALEVPLPLPLRQRRHRAFKWILEAVNKKTSKGSGRKQLPYRIAEEIIAVIEGNSSAWEKRRQIHKLGTVSRANVSSSKIKNAKKATRRK